MPNITTNHAITYTNVGGGGGGGWGKHSLLCSIENIYSQ